MHAAGTTPSLDRGMIGRLAECSFMQASGQTSIPRLIDSVRKLINKRTFTHRVCTCVQDSQGRPSPFLAHDHETKLVEGVPCGRHVKTINPPLRSSIGGARNGGFLSAVSPLPIGRLRAAWVLFSSEQTAPRSDGSRFHS